MYRNLKQDFAPPGFQRGAPQPAEYPREYRDFHHSSVNVGSILRSTGKMMLAGWVIDKLQVKEPLHRATVWALAGLGVGYVESLMKERKAQQKGR